MFWTSRLLLYISNVILSWEITIGLICTSSSVENHTWFENSCVWKPQLVSLTLNAVLIQTNPCNLNPSQYDTILSVVILILRMLLMIKTMFVTMMLKWKGASCFQSFPCKTSFGLLTLRFTAVSLLVTWWWNNTWQIWHVDIVDNESATKQHVLEFLV